MMPHVHHRASLLYHREDGTHRARPGPQDKKRGAAKRRRDEGAGQPRTLKSFRHRPVHFIGDSRYKIYGVRQNRCPRLGAGRLGARLTAPPDVWAAELDELAAASCVKR